MEQNDPHVVALLEAIEVASGGYSIQLTRLVDGEHTYTLDFNGDRSTYEDIDEAYQALHEKQRAIKITAAQEAIAAARRERDAEKAALEAENQKLRQMLVPQWFYADGYFSEECCDSPDEIIECLDLAPGRHIVSVDCAGPMPSIWCAVHVRTDEEMDAEQTDERVTFTEHQTKDAALAAIEPRT